MKKLLMAAVLFTQFNASAQAPDYPVAAPPRVVVKAEYFFDTDPGLGNATPLNLTPAADIANLSATITLNGSALNNGFHRLYIRTQDDAGRWSLTQSGFFDNVAVPVYPAAPGTAGNIVEVEYFIDADPGLGLGKKINVPAANDIASFNALIDLSGVASGAHRLYVRSKDAAGKWSLTHYAVFDNAAQTPYPIAPAAAPALTEAEYFFDSDPGFGNGVSISIPSSTDVTNFSLNVPVTNLSQGRHVLYLRSKQNPWSLTVYAEFMIGSILPVSWLYVKAEAKGTDALISWATGSEQNADKFIVEHSKDGIAFTKAGETDANNNPSGSSYSFRHLQPGNGVVYYRIKQVDKDGKSTYSKTMTLLFKEGMKTPVLFPNPASTVVNIVMPSGAIAKTVELYDAAGRLVNREQLQGIQSATLSLESLKAGKYIVVIKSDKSTTSHSVIKQ
jgi:hypothetical protein